MGQCLSILSALLLTVSVNAAEVPTSQVSFSQIELETLSPFDSEVQLRVLKDVVALMDQQFDVSQPLPEIRISESIEVEETDIIAAAESQGMPAWALAKGINMFLFDLNIILLGSDMKLHNLAHEYAHYVQYMYKKVSKEEFSYDYLEFEAVQVQKNFKVKKN